MDGRSDGQTVGRSEGRTDGRSDSRTVGQSDGRTVGRSDGRTQFKEGTLVKSMNYCYTKSDSKGLPELSNAFKIK